MPIAGRQAELDFDEGSYRFVLLACFFKQLLNHLLRLLVVAFTEVMIADSCPLASVLCQAGQ